MCAEAVLDSKTVGILRPLRLGSLCDQAWPLWINDCCGDSHCIALSEGDLVVFSGPRSEHGREEFRSDKQDQVLVHCVDADGASHHE